MSEIVPQIREYYRLSTTVINACLQAMLARYIGNLDARLNGAGIVTRQKYIMQSNGGMATFAATAKKAVATVLSGPAGSIVASLQVCRTTPFKKSHHLQYGRDFLRRRIDQAWRTLDHKSCQNRRSRYRLADDRNQYCQRGGGTLARVERFGQLEVGPQSAGAVPGPEKRLPTRYANYPLKSGDQFRLLTPGGGGFGTPFRRHPALVLQDIIEGYVTPERALKDYGVSIISDGYKWHIDESATRAARGTSH